MIVDFWLNCDIYLILTYLIATLALLLLLLRFLLLLLNGRSLLILPSLLMIWVKTIWVIILLILWWNDDSVSKWHYVAVKWRKGRGHPVVARFQTSDVCTTGTLSKSGDALRLSGRNIILYMGIRITNIIKGISTKLIQWILKVITLSIYSQLLRLMVKIIVYSHIISYSSFKIWILYHLRSLTMIGQRAFVPQLLVILWVYH